MGKILSPRAIIISRDLNLEEGLRSVFIKLGWEFDFIRSSVSGAEFLKEKNAFDLVVMDEGILDDEGLKNHRRSTVKDTFAAAQKGNPSSAYLLLRKEKSPAYQNLEKMSSLSAVFDREKFSTTRFEKLLPLLYQEKFQPVLISDLQDSKGPLPFDFYFLDVLEEEKEVYIPQGKPLPKKIVDLAVGKGVRHFYVSLQDFKKSSYARSRKKSELRERVRRVLIRLEDDSHLNSTHHGKKLRDEAREITLALGRLLKRFDSLADALEELTYPREMVLNHTFNTLVYTLVISHVLILDEKEDLAFAALFHDIARTPQAVKRLQEKMLPVSRLTQKLLSEHRENLKGLGEPYGLKLDPKELLSFVLPLAMKLDDERKVPKGEFEKSFSRALGALKKGSEVGVLYPESFVTAFSDALFQMPRKGNRP